jgi:hypothetical protein
MYHKAKSPTAAKIQRSGIESIKTVAEKVSDAITANEATALVRTVSPPRRYPRMIRPNTGWLASQA